MITANSQPAAHAGEDQSSRQMEARGAHWSNSVVQLVLAAKTFANNWLQAERDDVRACCCPEHHEDVRALFEAIKAADHTGLSAACAELVLLLADAEAPKAPARDPRVPDMFEIGGAA